METTIMKYSREAAKELRGLISSKFAVQGEGEFEVIATSEALDRDGEVIKADGWKLEPFKKNPVLLWAHDFRIPPIGAVTSLTRDGDKLIARGVFAKTEFAQEIRSLYDTGVLKTVSVGFIPLERRDNTILSAELLELSFVPVPANSEAVSLRQMEAVVAKGAKMAEQSEKTEGEEEEPEAEEPAKDSPESEGGDQPSDADEEEKAVDEEEEKAGCGNVMKAAMDDVDAILKDAKASMDDNHGGKEHECEHEKAYQVRKDVKAIEATITSMEETITSLKALLVEAKSANAEKAKTTRQSGDELLLSTVRVADKAIENAIRQIRAGK